MCFNLNITNPLYVKPSDKIPSKSPHQQRVEKLAEEVFDKLKLANILQPLTAQEDIIVYKSIRINKNETPYSYHSNQQDFKYEQDVENTVDDFEKVIIASLGRKIERYIEDFLFKTAHRDGFGFGMLDHPMMRLIEDTIKRTLNKNDKNSNELDGITSDEIITDCQTWNLELNKGFHSYKSNNLKSIYFNSLFIVPKGSFYYENDKEIISNKIIFKKYLSDEEISEISKKLKKEKNLNG